MKRTLDVLAISTLVVLCASWGTQQVAVKLALPAIPPYLQMGLRSLGAALLVALYCAMFRRPVWRLHDGTLRPGLATGALFAAEFVMIYVGLQWTDASRTSLLLYTAPFFVALGAHWLMPDERLGPAQWLGLFTCFAGIVLVMGSPHAAPVDRAWMGDLLILGAGLLWAATTLGIKNSTLRHAPPEKTLLYHLGVSGLVGVVGGLISGERLSWPGNVPMAALAYQTAWIAAVTFLLWLHLLARYPASLLQAGTSMTPLFGVVFAWLILDEPLTRNLVLAVVLMMIGLALINRKRT